MSIETLATQGPEPWFKVLGMLQQNWAAVFPQTNGRAVVHFFGDDSRIFDTLEFDSAQTAEGALEFNGFTRLSEDPSFSYIAGVPTYPLTHKAESIRAVYSTGGYWKVPPAGYRPRGFRLERSMKRFILAQDPVITTVYAELAEGRKKTHWMWFIFPQLAELGRSQQSKYFGLSYTDEARAFLATLHPGTTPAPGGPPGGQSEPEGQARSRLGPCLPLAPDRGGTGDRPGRIHLSPGVSLLLRSSHGCQFLAGWLA